MEAMDEMKESSEKWIESGWKNYYPLKSIYIENKINIGHFGVKNERSAEDEIP